MEAQAIEVNHSGQTPRRRKHIRRGTKFSAVLQALLERGSLNCFQAALEHHDFVLRSTIATLRREYGLTFHKAEESVPGHNGSSVRCTRYSLTAEDRAM